MELAPSQHPEALQTFPSPAAPALPCQRQGWLSPFLQYIFSWNGGPWPAPAGTDAAIRLQQRCCDRLAPLPLWGQLSLGDSALLALSYHLGSTSLDCWKPKPRKPPHFSPWYRRCPAVPCAYRGHNVSSSPGKWLCEVLLGPGLNAWCYFLHLDLLYWEMQPQH